MAEAPISSPDAVIRFWTNAGPERWFKPDAGFDAECRSRLEPLWRKAASGELDDWQDAPDGALALVILLDQLPRNMFRGTPQAYATDARALDVARAAISRGDDARVPALLRRFFVLPFTHSEMAADQHMAVTLNEAHGDAETLKWAIHHRDIVLRFGRFPHRNALLGRESTPEERAWLAAPDAFRG